MARYPAPTGYAPGGVSYYNTKKKAKVYPAPTGYAPGGVEYGPLKRKNRSRIVNPSGTTRVRPGRGAAAQPVGVSQDGQVLYKDPNTGEIYTKAEQRVHEQTDPLLALIAKREAEERAQAEADAASRGQAIATAYSNERAPTQALYDHAVQQAKDVENAISAKFGKEGETNVSALKAKLDEIGGAVGDQAAQSVYQNADAARYATGMNDVARLAARGAEAQNWLGTQSALEQSDVQQDLFDLLAEISTDYGDQRDELNAGLAGQIQELYESMLADSRDQAQGDYERRIYEREYKDKQAADESASVAARTEAIRDQYNKDRQYLLQQKALAFKDPLRTKKIDAQIKALDRQAKKDIADANNATRVDIANAGNQTRVDVANANATNRARAKQPRAGVVSSTLSKDSPVYVDEQGNPVIDPRTGKPKKNPAYKKSGSGNTNDSVATAGSAKRNRAYQAALNAVFNKGSGKVRDVAVNAKNPDMWIQRQINAAIEGMGVPPNSKEGAEIRRAIFRFLDGRPAGKGTYHKPKWVK